MEGVITKSTGSWYTVLYDGGRQIQCKLRGLFRKDGSKATNPVAVGDKVVFDISPKENIGIITGILERKNHIIRKATKLSRQTHVIAANIDQAVLIVTLAEPRTSTGFIDRYLVTAEAYSIPARIIFNKYDIYDREQLKTLEELSRTYEPLGYECLFVSAKEKTNIEAFNDLLKDKTTLLSGLSGVGKSTLLNAIEPELNLKTQPISKTHKKGVHTTTFAEMFQLGNGGRVIDTPGIKEFGLVDVEDWELSHYFPEMRELFNECRFDNCTHVHEPGCKIVEQLEEGKIYYSRYLNYLSMLEKDDNRR